MDGFLWISYSMEMRRFSILSIPLWMVLGCGQEDQTPHPYEGYVSHTYRNDSWWLCKPDSPTDYCAGDIDATEVLADGSFALAPHRPADDPAVDCFYVYPTVDLDSYPGNHDDPSDVEAILDPILSQAARFTGLCRVYAPYYRQATLGCYLSEGNQEYFDLAYRDVLDAFKHYLANFNGGRDLVILGHSQGSMHLIRLLQMEFDTLPKLRQLLVSALLVGRNVFVPPGEAVGGSFQNIPVCKTTTATGCVVSFSSFAEDFPPQQAGFQDQPSPYQGMQNVCVNPGSPAGDKTPLITYFPRHSQFAELPLPGGVTEPFGLYRDFFHGECRTNPHGFAYLQISEDPAPGDERANPADFEELSSIGAVFGNGQEMGLHLLDYNLALGDLLELVESQIAGR